ncbi:MAG: hypothetical protein KGL39_26825 [Patescibacteria group bacterium]|nr:hypothetical protein [Patescibacteria group bacterium]
MGYPNPPPTMQNLAKRLQDAENDRIVREAREMSTATNAVITAFWAQFDNGTLPMVQEPGKKPYYRFDPNTVAAPAPMGAWKRGIKWITEVIQGASPGMIILVDQNGVFTLHLDDPTPVLCEILTINVTNKPPANSSAPVNNAPVNSAPASTESKADRKRGSEKDGKRCFAVKAGSGAPDATPSNISAQPSSASTPPTPAKTNERPDNVS